MWIWSPRTAALCDHPTTPRDTIWGHIRFEGVDRATVEPPGGLVLSACLLESSLRKMRQLAFSFRWLAWAYACFLWYFGLFQFLWSYLPFARQPLAEPPCQSQKNVFLSSPSPSCGSCWYGQPPCFVTFLLKNNKTVLKLKKKKNIILKNQAQSLYLWRDLFKALYKYHFLRLPEHPGGWGGGVGATPSIVLLIPSVGLAGLWVSCPTVCSFMLVSVLFFSNFGATPKENSLLYLLPWGHMIASGPAFRTGIHSQASHSGVAKGRG